MKFQATPDRKRVRSETVGAACSINKLTKPQLQKQESPQAAAPIALARNMLVYQRSDELAVEQATPRGRVVQQRLAQHRRKLAPQPFGGGDRKASLRLR